MSPLAALTLLALALRIPAFLNYDNLNSDCAVAGLQALHLLKGELSWFLWGVGYQASFESILTAVGVAIFGDHTLVMMGVGFVGYWLVMAVTFALLRPTLGAKKAVLATLFLVIASSPLFHATLYPPRQWAITFSFVSLWCLGHGRLPGVGMFLAFFALYVDFIAIQFFPGLLVVAFLTGGKRRVPKWAYGFLAGALFLGLTRFLGPKGGPPLALNFNVLAKTVTIFFEEAWPALLSMPTWIPSWEAKFPAWYRSPVLLIVRSLAGLTFLAGMVVSARRLFTDGSVPAGLRRLGLFGVVTTLVSLAAFFTSPMVWDVWASRYLASVLWVAPFTLAPLYYRLSAGRIGLFSAPYFACTLLALWVCTGEMVQGATAVGRGVRELELATFLRAKGITHAKAPFWSAYRMTYLFRENPIVVPHDPKADRYPPYRAAVEAAPHSALIFDAQDSESAILAAVEEAKAVGFRPEPFQVAGYRGFLLRKN